MWQSWLSILKPRQTTFDQRSHVYLCEEQFNVTYVTVFVNNSMKGKYLYLFETMVLMNRVHAVSIAYINTWYSAYFLKEVCQWNVPLKHCCVVLIISTLTVLKNVVYVCLYARGEKNPIYSLERHARKQGYCGIGHKTSSIYHLKDRPFVRRMQHLSFLKVHLLMNKTLRRMTSAGETTGIAIRLL
jgi:hypothetical protein